MDKRKFFKLRLYFTGLVAIAIWALLAWNYYHGGVPAHHILANKDLPAISNWWSALLLPLLSWFLMYRIQERAFPDNQGDPHAQHLFRGELYGFAVALLFGILLSAIFTLGYPDIPGYMLLGLLLCAFFFPIYRPECLLGFVIGMTFTFGAVLPTVFGTLMGLAGVVLYLYIRPGIQYIASKLFS
jgi:hypothetical protein